MGVEKPKRCKEEVLTNRPDIVTNVTLINQVNVESNRRMPMGNIKLDVVAEEKKITKRPPRVYATHIGSKKIDFQQEFENRFEILQ